MTSNAVTASMCASASDVALLVASLMPFLPEDWTRLFVAQEHTQRRLDFYSEHPRIDVRFASPHSASIDSSKDRLVMRRQLGPLMLLLRRCVGNVWAISDKKQ
jgi:hypothetical protein